MEEEEIELAANDRKGARANPSQLSAGGGDVFPGSGEQGGAGEGVNSGA